MPRKNEFKIKPAQVEAVITDYLQECITNKKVPFMVEVALRLGIDKSTFLRYLQKPAYAPIIKRLKDSSELALLDKVINDNKPVGGIFLLKSMFSYIEAQKMDITSNGETVGVVQLPSRIPHK